MHYSRASLLVISPNSVYDVYKLPEILQEMKENLLQSRYYNESQNLYNQLFSKPKPRWSFQEEGLKWKFWLSL